MEKIHIASSDICNFLNGSLILYISESKADNCSALLCIVSKINRAFRARKKSSLSTETFGVLHLAYYGHKICHKDF